MSRFTPEQQLSFELNKHYASVLSIHYGWARCQSTVNGCFYTTLTGNRGSLTSAQLHTAGKAIEDGKSRDN